MYTKKQANSYVNKNATRVYLGNENNFTIAISKKNSVEKKKVFSQPAMFGSKVKILQGGQTVTR